MENSDLAAKIEEILRNVLFRPVKPGERIVTDGAIDSLGFVDLTVEFEKAFGITIDALEFKAEFFDSVPSISQFVQAKLNQLPQ